MPLPIKEEKQSSHNKNLCGSRNGIVELHSNYVFI